MSYGEDVNLRDLSKAVVNPAVKEKQQETIEKLELTRAELLAAFLASDIANAEAIEALKLSNEADLLGVNDKLSTITGVVVDCEGSPVVSVKACEVMPVYMGVPPQDIATRFFTNPDFGVDMNVDAVSDVTYTQADWVHSGGATGEAVSPEVAWTPSQVVGTAVNFNATGAFQVIDPYEGSFFIDARNAAGNDSWQFVADSLPVAASATHIQFRLYVERWESNANRDCFIQLRNGAVAASAEVSLRSDVGVDRTGSIGVWQRVRVPLSMFNLTGPWTGMRFRLGHSNVDLAFDRITLQSESGSGINTAFSVTPQEGRILLVEVIQFTFVAPMTIGASGLPSVDHNKFGSVPNMMNGILYERIQSNQVVNSFTIRRLWDLMRIASVSVTTHANENELTYIVRYAFQRPAVLRSSAGDELRYSVRDDMSSLLEFNISSDGASYPDPDWPAP